MPKFKLNVTSTSNSEFDVTHDLKIPMESAIKFVGALYRFIRPYAAAGTVSLLTVQKLSDFSPLFFMKMLQDLVVPGGVVVPKVSQAIKCDKSERTRFHSDVLSFNQVS